MKNSLTKRGREYWEEKVRPDGNQKTAGITRGSLQKHKVGETTKTNWNEKRKIRNTMSLDHWEF